MNSFEKCNSDLKQKFTNAAKNSHTNASVKTCSPSLPLGSTLMAWPVPPEVDPRPEVWQIWFVEDWPIWTMLIECTNVVQYWFPFKY